MKTVKIIDMTLREPATGRDGALSFKEKLEIAKMLDRLKVDTIELPAVSGAKADVLCNKTIAATVKTEVSASVNIGSGNIEETWESIKEAKNPVLNLIAPVSTVQMEYTCHKKAPKMLEAVTEQVKQCRFYCETVEFTACDATRAEEGFLPQIVAAAIEAGAKRITLCDTAGIMLPDEFTAFVKNVIDEVPAVKDIDLFVQISDELNMATANAAAAINAGATGVKCSAAPAGYPTISQISSLIKKKGTDMDIASDIRATEIERVVSQISKIIFPEEIKTSSFKDIGLGDIADVTLDANDDINEVNKVVKMLGYELSEEDAAKVYESFKRVADKKHYVGTKELDAIIASTAMQVPSRYRLDNFVSNSGNIISATANVLLDRNGEKLRGVGVGDGPIDAAFLAIEEIIGHHYELDDFQIRTVTEGTDAMGSAVVKLRSNGRVYSGSGLSTDIIGASIRAYISALNKIVYEEEQH